MSNSRPIWNGTISFGLINIPVALYSAENPEKLNFHLLDKRNNARIHYERINETTGQKVPWDKIVKAYEFEKKNYVIIDESKLEQKNPENKESFEIENFIPENAISPLYFEKPYYLLPNKQGEKGYFLLKETLKKTKKMAIGKVIIKTRQHLCALLPQEDILILNTLRFETELRKLNEISQTNQDFKKIKISKKEFEMAERLIESMSTKWNPQKYHNETREILKNWLQQKIRKGKSITDTGAAKHQKQESAKVIDFMQLLKKSIDTKAKHKKLEKEPKKRKALKRK